MKNISKLVIALGVSAASVFTANSASAELTGAATISFSGTVVPECTALDSNPNAPTSTIAYGESTTVVGPDSINIGTGDAERIDSLFAATTIAFDCNTLTVDVSLVNNSAIFPDGPSGLTVTRIDEVSDGTESDTSDISGAETDANGDIDITVISTFTAGGEELPAGDYAASYTVTVAPN